MKNIVLEINHNEAVILSDDGTVSKIKNNNYSIGQVISMENTKKPKSKLYTFAASFVAAMIILTVGVFAYFTPVNYVSLDVNPSIEYTINLFDRVLSFESVNEDGKQIIQNLNLKNKKITQALEETLEKIVAEGYITKSENAGVVISITDSAKAEVLVNEILEKTEKYLADNDESDEIDVDVEVEAVGRERVTEARKLGITPGKLNLIEKLRDSTDDPDDFVIEDWVDKSVQEINKAVKENRKNKKAEDKIDNNNDKDNADDSNDDVDEDEDDDDDDDVNQTDSNKPNKEKNKENNRNKNKDKAKSNNGNNGRGDDDDDNDDDDHDDDVDNDYNANNSTKNKDKDNNNKYNNNNNNNNSSNNNNKNNNNYNNNKNKDKDTKNDTKNEKSNNGKSKNNK
jgi:hypothetical protein